MKKGLFLLVLLLISFVLLFADYPASNGDNAYAYITNVTFSNINNNTGAETGGYGDFTAMSADVQAGETYEISVTVQLYDFFYINAWIDWNQDDVFDDLEEKYEIAVNEYGVSTHTHNITVPIDALTGTTRMRVSYGVFSSPAPDETDFTGEVEDYSINVTVPLPDAPYNPNPVSGAIDIAHALELTCEFGANTDSYDVYFDTSDPPVTMVVDNAPYGTSVSYYAGSLTPTTIYYWKIVARNGGGDTDSEIWNFTTSENGTHVSGTVSGLWDLAGSPYFVDGQITILQDTTLGIEAGVEVILTGYYNFDVYGALQANGTDGNMIEFSRNDNTGFEFDNSEVGAWNGLFYHGGRNRTDYSNLDYCIFRNSKAISGGEGGVIYAQNDVYLNINNCQFIDNYADSKGGAICFFSAANSENIIENCYFYNNQSTDGGAIYFNSSQADLVNNIFENNQVPLFDAKGGAIFLNNGSNIDLIGNLFFDNAAYQGGTIYAISSEIRVINCTITENDANSGSAYYAEYGSCTLINNIIWNNIGMLFIWNTADGSYNASYSDIENHGGYNWTSINDCIDIDPEFTSVTADDYTLSDDPLSPCIDMGNPDITGLNLPDYDLAGTVRVLGTVVDMGAYETLLPPVADFHADVTSGYKPLTVNFTNNSNNSTSWEWDFDDDDTIDSTEENPTFIYEEADTYTVTLTAYNDEMDISVETKIDYINVHHCTRKSGSVGGEEWEADGNPYIIEGDIFVNLGEDLTIEEGVIILFEENYRFDVHGNLNAIGSVGSGNSILFSVTDPSGYSQGTHTGWNGLRFYDQPYSGVYVSFLDYCIFEYGKSFGGGNGNLGGAIYLENSSGVSIKHTSISKCMAEFGGAIYATANSNFLLQNSLLVENNAGIQGSVIYCEQSSPTFLNLTVANNNQNSLSTVLPIFLLDSNPSVKNSIIWNVNSDFELSQAGSSNAIVSYTSIQDDIQGEGVINIAPTFKTSSYKLAVVDPNNQSNQLVDAGDPADDIGQEPNPHGGRINMGAYGGTIEATYAASIAPPEVFENSFWPNIYLHLVNQQLLVGSDATLEIEPGALVDISDNTSITISGKLTANGTESDKIKFSSDIVEDEQRGDIWDGLIFGDGADNLSVLNNVIIENATNGINLNSNNIDINNTEVIFDSSAVRGTGEVGVILGDGSEAKITNCDIENYEYGIKIVTPRNSRETAMPEITDTTIRTSGESSSENLVGIYMEGDIAATIDGCIIDDFTEGIKFIGTGVRTRNTPTITNTRIRTSGQSSRNVTTGLYIDNVVNIEIQIDSLLNYPTGIEIVNNGTTRNESTPSITNTRIRTSGQSSRENIVGIYMEGDIAATIDGCIIDDFAEGIKIIGTGIATRSTPTITNTRIRTSGQSSRDVTTGLYINNVVNINVQIDSLLNYPTGIEIVNNDSTRNESTPTITNTRIRTSGQSSRENEIGIITNGNVSANIENCEIDNQNQGIVFKGPNSSVRSTPTITNTRIRTSGQSSRSNSNGIFIDDLSIVEIDSCEVENYTVGIEFSCHRDSSAYPYITNTKIKSSAENSRTMYTGLRFSGLIDGDISNNEIVNVDTAIVMSGYDVIMNITQNEIYMHEKVNQDSSSIAIYAENCASITMKQNTIHAYDYGYISVNAFTEMMNNIIWNDNQVNEPVTIGPDIVVRYCDISRPAREAYPGVGNINNYPCFYNVFLGRFELLMNSPCIDTGDPEEPLDPDGSVADMGVYYDPFLIDFEANQMFGYGSHIIQFTPEAVGFPEIGSTWSWDTNADSSYDAFGISPTVTYEVPGIYSVRLRVQKAGIEDYLYKENFIVIQDTELPAPQNPQISLNANDVMLSWDDIVLRNRTDRNQIYFLIYISDRPDGGFEYVDHTTNEVTSYSHQDILLSVDRAFYKIIAFEGTWEQLRTHVSSLRKYKIKKVIKINNLK
ncbi:MAG: right-handed parallel beta-helix repeat-containing protein [Candidatus Cloacimonetes bacterium]|nr:right-handed parallel beta-helix repeat-containing protein [Candidatus Cloacimonadota bacterium]